MGRLHRRLWLWPAVALTVLAGCGSTTPSGSPTTTVAPPTTVAPCPRFGSTAATAGDQVGAPAGGALLRNVQVQASACVDEVSFLFWTGSPSWSAGYRDGSLTLDPSGQPAELGGGAHLVIRFQPASGTDLSVDPPRQTYDGPTAMTPAAPSSVVAVRSLGDFEGVVTWGLGLPERRTFQVVTRPNQVVVRFAAPTPRRTSCAAHEAELNIGYPGDWYAELSPLWACRYFDPAPFVILTATDATDWAVTAGGADGPARTVVSSASSGATSAAIVRRTRVAGLPATVLDVTANGAGLVPAGWVYRMYVVETTPDAFVIGSSPTPPGPRAERAMAGADRIAALVTRR